MSKRTFDVIISFIGIILSLPVYLVCAIAIRIESKGPIFFRQVRVGKNKKPFTIFKFRSMLVEISNGVHVTHTNDARVTRVGRWLRKYKLDELPQLFNVLRGEMSLVGPRPEVPKYIDHYSEKEQLVFSVRPGMTDIASIRYRNEAELIPATKPESFYIKNLLHQKLDLNLKYLRSQSVLGDIKILIYTALVSLFPSLDGQKIRAWLDYRVGDQFSNSVLLKIHELDKRIRGRKRILLKLMLDTMVIVAAYYFAFLIRFEGQLLYNDWLGFLRTAPLLIFISIGVYYVSNIYRGLWEYVSIREILALMGVHTLAWLLFAATTVLIEVYWVPRSVLAIYWFLAFVGLGGLRVLYRVSCRQAKVLVSKRQRVLIVGAGDAGEMILRQITNNPYLGYQPVAFVDDDERKVSARIHGVPVLGSTTEISALVIKEQIDQIIIATPSASANEMRRIVSRCEDSGADFKTVPGTHELMNGKVSLSQLRDVKIEDLLERDPIHADGMWVGRFLRGKVVMVTGAGGSIGQELCRQILRYQPKNLVMLDRAENSLFYLDNDFRAQWQGSYTTVVGDICDVRKMAQVFQAYQPMIVFHAAAHKHVPLMELNPEEAIKNNLRGTITVGKLAKEYGVENFVLISTDKAVEPTNMMGASKRLAELYVQAAGHDSTTKFVTVRFGNVLGSNGSVVTLFQKQIAHGGPVTITDPDMTRYFMTISEAVSLILQASSIGNGGEIFVLDMGEPIKVVDMARHLITLSGLKPDQDIRIKVIGARPGEKIYEQLWHEAETPERTHFEKIWVARTEGHNHWYLQQQLEEILDLADAMQREALFDSIHTLIPSYRPHNGVKVPAVVSIDAAKT